MADLEQLRELPAVDQVLDALKHLNGRFPRRLIVEEVRRALEKTREDIRAGRHANPALIEQRVERNLAKLEAPSLRRVINATGVVLHTNLGRAPLAPFEPLIRLLESGIRSHRRPPRQAGCPRRGADRTADRRAGHRGEQQRRRDLSGFERTGARDSKWWCRAVN